MANFTKNRFEAATTEWPTPQSFFDRLDAEFAFDLDPCATNENAKCAFFFTKDEDGLVQPWGASRVWLNPPYGREMILWLRKAVTESKLGSTVVALIPARTNTRWFKEIASCAAEIRLVCGRPKFGGASHGLPFPLVLLIFRPGHSGAPKIGFFDSPG